MKRLLFILSIGLAAFLASCSDKDDTPTSDALTGTVWSQTVGDRTDTFYFGINHSCTCSWEYKYSRPIEEECWYYYKAPNIRIETGANTHTGRIEDDMLYIHMYDRDLALKKIR